MRTSPFYHWVLASVPLLAVLSVIFFSFGSEQEVALFFKEHSAAHPQLKAVFKFLTDWSNPLLYGVYAWLLFSAIRTRNTEQRRFVIVMIIMQLIVGLVAVNFLKHMIGRPRPGQGMFFEPLTTRGSYHSLPSGHTTEIYGWVLPLIFRQHQLWFTGCLGLFAGAVGFSRIYLSWHYPSDVFFGWLLGSVTAYATWTLANSGLFRKKA